MYSGFSSRRLQDRYNLLIGELLRTLTQMVISCSQSARVHSFRTPYLRLVSEMGRLDAYKYSQFKVSAHLQPLTQFLSMELPLESKGQEPKARRTLEREGKYRKRTLSNSSERRAPTMEELMRMNPIIERKISTYKRIRDRITMPIKEEEDQGFE